MLSNLDTGLVLVIIAGFILGSLGLLAGILVILFGRSNVSDRIQQYVEVPTQEKKKTGTKDHHRLNRFRYRLNLALGVLNSEEFQLKLASAGWRITVSEYHLIRLITSFGILMLGTWLLGSWIAGIALAVIAYSIPGFLMFRAVNKRQKLFQDQLIDSLTLIRGAVSAGSSFLQSLDVVSNEMVPPSSEEFRRVRREVE